jgi:hypothetical protein
MQVFAKNEPAAVPEGSIVMKMYTLTELGLVAGVTVHHNPYPRILIGSGEGAREITMGRRDFPHGLQGPYPTLSKEERNKAPQYLKEAGLRCPHLGEVWEFRDLVSEMYWDPKAEPGTIDTSPQMEERNRLIKAGCPICGAPWASATPHGVVHVDAALSDGVDLRRRADKDGWVLLAHPNPAGDQRALVLVDVTFTSEIQMPVEGARRPEIIESGKRLVEAAIPERGGRRALYETVARPSTSMNICKAIVMLPGREFTVVRSGHGQGPDTINVSYDPNGPASKFGYKRDPEAEKARALKADQKAKKQEAWKQAIEHVNSPKTEEVQS